MAKDGVFFAGVARVHPAHACRWCAIVLQGWWATVIARRTYAQVVNYVVAMDCIFFGLYAVCSFRPAAAEDRARRFVFACRASLTTLLFIAAQWMIVVVHLAARSEAGVHWAGHRALAGLLHLFSPAMSLRRRKALALYAEWAKTSFQRALQSRNQRPNECGAGRVSIAPDDLQKLPAADTATGRCWNASRRTPARRSSAS